MCRYMCVCACSRNAACSTCIRTQSRISHARTAAGREKAQVVPVGGWDHSLAAIGEKVAVV